MSKDTGSKLRSIYEQDGGVHEVFSARVADYLASRPDYPAPLFETLGAVCGLSPGAVVADIGSGTGLFTRTLLNNGYRVVAVEPNAAMRKACDQLLGHFPEYRSVAGCAESIPLEGSSVDLVTAAQSFHWFEIDMARTECLRILRPRGQVALIWNDRDSDDPFQKELDAISDEFGGAKRSALIANEDCDNISSFFGTVVPREFSWTHEHVLDVDGLVSLVFSRSYIPGRDSSIGQVIDHRVRQVFDRFSFGEKLAIHYRTTAIVGRPG